MKEVSFHIISKICWICWIMCVSVCAVTLCQWSLQHAATDHKPKVQSHPKISPLVEQARSVCCTCSPGISQCLIFHFCLSCSIIFYPFLTLLTIQHRLRPASPAQLLPRLARPATNAATQGPLWISGCPNPSHNHPCKRIQKAAWSLDPTMPLKPGTGYWS